MTLSYRNSISVFQVVVYIPMFAIACFLWKRDGFGPGSAAWRFSTAFCSLRLTGAICSLIAISVASEGLKTAILVSQVVGLQPLTLSLITLTDRINVKANIVPKTVYFAIMLVSVVALILGIYGADKLLDGNITVIRPNAYIQAAMAVFLFLYAFLVGLLLFFGSKWTSYPDSTDRRVILALGSATFFLGVKHIEAAISDFGNLSAFGVVSGSTNVYFFMSVLMEILTVGIDLGFGLTYGHPQRPLDNIESGSGDGSLKPE